MNDGIHESLSIFISSGYVYRIQKNGTEEFTYKATVEKQTEK